MMKKLLLFSLGIILIGLTACRQEENLSNEKTKPNLITSKKYVKKSPWVENIDFITRAQATFLEHTDLEFFTKEYGVIYWDYAMSFVEENNSILAIPLVKNGEVYSTVEALVKNGKIYFLENKNKDFIRIFKTIMNTKPRLLVAYKNPSSKNLPSSGLQTKG